MNLIKTLALSLLMGASPVAGTAIARAETAPAAASTAARFETKSFLFATTGGQKLYLDRIVDVSRKFEGKRPVVVYSFGGGWEGGARNDPLTQSFFRHLAERGFTVVTIDYRLAIKEAKEKGEFTPANVVPLYQRAIRWGVEDLYDATAFLLEHADEWGIDPEQIVIAGSSAGATNSLVAEYHRANRTELAAAHLPADFRYAGVIAMAGAFWLDRGSELTFRTSPAPFMFFHGAKDQLVTYDESHDTIAAYGPVAFQRKYSNGDVPSWFVDLPEADHVMAMAPLIDYRHEIDAFLDKMVRQKQQMVIHSIETDRVSKTFANVMQLYGAHLRPQSAAKP